MFCPRWGRERPKQLTIKYYVMDGVNANNLKWGILRGSICWRTLSSPPLMRHERIKVLVEKQMVLFQCPGWSGNDQNN